MHKEVWEALTDTQPFSSDPCRTERGECGPVGLLGGNTGHDMKCWGEGRPRRDRTLSRCVPGVCLGCNMGQKKAIVSGHGYIPALVLLFTSYKSMWKLLNPLGLSFFLSKMRIELHVRLFWCSMRLCVCVRVCVCKHTQCDWNVTGHQ